MVMERGIDIHPTALSFNDMLTRAREHARECIAKAAEYNKERWDKTHKETEFKVGDHVSISTVNFNNFQGPRKLRDLFVGPFIIMKIHGQNAAEVLLTGEYSRKHPTFPVTLLKHFESRNKSQNYDKESTPVPFEEATPNVVEKILQHKRISVDGKPVLVYLVRHKNKGADFDEWLEEKDIANTSKLLRNYRIDKRSLAT